MAKIILDIKKCSEGCPYCKAKAYDRPEFDYFCSYDKDLKKIIALGVESSWEMPEIPDWCPIRLDEKRLIGIVYLKEEK